MGATLPPLYAALRYSSALPSTEMGWPQLQAWTGVFGSLGLARTHMIRRRCTHFDARTLTLTSLHISLTTWSIPSFGPTGLTLGKRAT